MIASLQGVVTHKYKDALVLVVQGVGYLVHVTETTYNQTQSGTDLHLHTVLTVREDALTLYGFKSIEEKEIFETITSVSGVGPKMGLAILSTMSADNLRNAIASERHELLTRVPGIGAKTAKKIVFELKDKLLTRDAIPIDFIDGADINADVLDTLLALGFSVVEAQSALQKLPLNAPEDVEERVRLALQQLG